jgi:hypothetical protein
VERRCGDGAAGRGEKKRGVTAVGFHEQNFQGSVRVLLRQVESPNDRAERLTTHMEQPQVGMRCGSGRNIEEEKREGMERKRRAMPGSQDNEVCEMGDISG